MPAHDEGSVERSHLAIEALVVLVTRVLSAFR